ncbi:MAG: universal stress protein [Runella sp.]
MKTILVPTDFSENAFHAAKYAAVLAQQYDMGLRLVHVFTLHIVSEIPHSSFIEAEINRQQHDADDSMAKFKQKLANEANIDARRIETKVLSGFLVEHILNYAENTDVAMIVMGTRGASTWIDRWLGTNAQHIMEKAACPVWVVPSNTPLTPPKYVIYASDFRGDEVAEINTILPILRPLGARLTVVHIRPDDALTIGTELEDTLKELRQTFKNENVTVKNLNRRTITGGLKTYLKNQKPDLLAVMRTERGFWENLFLKSISKHFVQEATQPVLVFKVKSEK